MKKILIIICTFFILETSCTTIPELKLVPVNNSVNTSQDEEIVLSSSLPIEVIPEEGGEVPEGKIEGSSYNEVASTEKELAPVPIIDPKNTIKITPETIEESSVSEKNLLETPVILTEEITADTAKSIDIVSHGIGIETEILTDTVEEVPVSDEKQLEAPLILAEEIAVDTAKTIDNIPSDIVGIEAESLTDEDEEVTLLDKVSIKTPATVTEDLIAPEVTDDDALGVNQPAEEIKSPMVVSITELSVPIHVEEVLPDSNEAVEISEDIVLAVDSEIPDTNANLAIDSDALEPLEDISNSLVLENTKEVTDTRGEDIETTSWIEPPVLITSQDSENVEEIDSMLTTGKSREENKSNNPEIIIEIPISEKSDVSSEDSNGVESNQLGIPDPDDEIKTSNELEDASSDTITEIPSKEAIIDTVVLPIIPKEKEELVVVDVQGSYTELPQIIELESIEEPLSRQIDQKPKLITIIGVVVGILLILIILLLLFSILEPLHKFKLKYLSMIKSLKSKYLLLISWMRGRIDYVMTSIANLKKRKSTKSVTPSELPNVAVVTDEFQEVQESEFNENYKDEHISNEESILPELIETEQEQNQENPYSLRLELLATILELYTQTLDTKLPKPLGDIDQFIVELFDLDKKTSGLLKNTKNELFNGKVDYHLICRKYIDILPKSDIKKIIKAVFFIISIAGYLYEIELQALKKIFSIFHIKETIIEQLVKDYSIQIIAPTTKIVTRNNISKVLKKNKDNNSGKSVDSISEFDDEILTQLVSIVDELKMSL